jgi:hypothetical protein
LIEVDCQQCEPLIDIPVKGAGDPISFSLFCINQPAVHACESLLGQPAEIEHQASNDQRSDQESRDGHVIERIVNPKRVRRGSKVRQTQSSDAGGNDG